MGDGGGGTGQAGTRGASHGPGATGSEPSRVDASTVLGVSMQEIVDTISWPPDET